MALVFVEGFDHFAASQATAKSWSATFSSMQAGRFDGQAARITSSSSTKTKALPSSYSTLIVGFAYRTANLSTSISFFQIRAGATLTCQLFFDGSGHIVVKNSSGTVIATGTTVLSTNQWNYIEVKLVINGASGSCEVHLNGASEISSTTGNFGSTNVDTLALLTQTGAGAGTNDYDDMYACDTTGTTNNTFLGDVRVETLFPNGAGSHTAWTPNGAASNYACVNETTPDDDTTYVSDSNVGDIDTYAFTDVDGGATVLGVQRNVYARKDDANTRQIAMLVRQGGTDYVGATQTLASGYAFYSERKDADPAGAAWTAANINGDEWGVKVIS